MKRTFAILFILAFIFYAASVVITLYHLISTSLAVLSMLMCVGCIFFIAYIFLTKDLK